MLRTREGRPVSAPRTEARKPPRREVSVPTAEDAPAGSPVPHGLPMPPHARPAPPEQSASSFRAVRGGKRTARHEDGLFGTEQAGGGNLKREAPNRTKTENSRRRTGRNAGKDVTKTEREAGSAKPNEDGRIKTGKRIRPEKNAHGKQPREDRHRKGERPERRKREQAKEKREKAEQPFGKRATVHDTPWRIRSMKNRRQKYSCRRRRGEPVPKSVRSPRPADGTLSAAGRIGETLRSVTPDSRADQAASKQHRNGPGTHSLSREQSRTPVRFLPEAGNGREKSNHFIKPRAEPNSFRLCRGGEMDERNSTLIICRPLAGTPRDGPDRRPRSESRHSCPSRS